MASGKLLMTGVVNNQAAAGGGPVPMGGASVSAL
jgi:hypothetical protein